MQSKIEKQNVEDIISLSPMQEGMLFLYLNDSKSTMYYEQMCLKMNDSVDVELLLKAWQYVIDSNEMLRTIYRWENLKSPIQVVLKKQSITIDEYDFCEFDNTKKERKTRELKKKLFQEGLDLGTRTFKITLLKLAQGEYEMIVYRHQIIYDGWSNGILLKELIGAYNILKDGGTPKKKIKRKYKEYVDWVKRQSKEESKNYWRSYLREFDTKTTLPYNTRRSNVDMEVASYSFRLTDEISERITTFVRENKVTMASLFFTAYGILLQRYNNYDDVIFGTTVSGRTADIDGIENIIGLFISTLPMRIKTSVDTSIRELLTKVMHVLGKRGEYDDLSLLDIKKCSMLSAMENLFDSVIILENYPLDESVVKAENGLQVRFESITEETNFDLTIQILMQDRIEFNFIYNQNVFYAETIKQLAQHFRIIVEKIITSPNEKVSQIEILTKEERKELLFDLNDTSYQYPKEKLIHQMIREQADRTPDKIAVTYEKDSITYRLLNEKSNILARMLMSAGVCENSMVGIYIPRSVDLIIGVLAVLKANAVYVPLDVDHPVSRTDYILEDSGARILLQSSNQQYEGNFVGKILNIDEDIGMYDNNNTDDKLKSDSVACLIYTSGSTGKPKGVMLHHYGIINHALTKAKELDISEDDIVGNNFSVNVVASIWQIFLPLMLGATLVVYSEQVEKDPYQQFECIARDHISIIQLIPSVLNVYIWLIEKGKKKIELKNLRAIALTSEEVKASLVERFYSFYDIQLVDCYGQTECCDDTLHYRIPKNKSMETVPIGTPSFNTRVYVLNRHLRLQPKGVIGELYILGDGVSKGYWKQPELTKEKFLDSPFEPGKKLYCTGDLARWNKNGYVEYMGRADHQVKVRGNRIELGEIENVLLKHEEVESVTVMCRTDAQGENYLCAYLVMNQELTVYELSRYLGKQLPDYMIPSQFIRLDEMPLTPNGKVDRKRLPVSTTNLSTGENFVQPQSATEKELQEIWSELLNRKDISMNDSFFELGGNSLMLIQLKEVITKRFEIDLSVQDLFAYPTIIELAKFIKGDEGKGEKQIIKGIEVLEEYLNHAGGETRTYTYTYSFFGDSYSRLLQIQEQEEVDCFTILVSLYTIALSKITKGETMEALVSFRDFDEIVPMQIEESDLKDFHKLLELVNTYRLNQVDQAITSKEFDNVANLKTKTSMIPFIYNKYQPVRKPNYLEVFDIIVTVEEANNQITFVFEYRSKKLNADKMKEFVNSYINLIQYVTKNYSGIKKED